jgi:hypothetical protein
MIISYIISTLILRALKILMANQGMRVYICEHWLTLHICYFILNTNFSSMRFLKKGVLKGQIYLI